MAHPAPTSDWIEWTGGKCPVKADALVEVRFRKGTTCDELEAGEYDSEDLQMSNWTHGEPFPELDIIAYRVVQA